MNTKRHEFWRVWLLIVLVAALLGGGCAVAPKAVTTKVVAFDGNQQNGGLLDDGRGKPLKGPRGGLVITAAAREKYNQLIDRQSQFKARGFQLEVTLARDAGVDPLPNGTFEIDKQHFEAFATLNRWFKEGKANSLP